MAGEESVVKGNRGGADSAVGQVESSREEADEVVVDEEDEEEEEEEEEEGGEVRGTTAASLLNSCLGITRILFFTILVGITNFSPLLSKKRHSFLP